MAKDRWKRAWRIPRGSNCCRGRLVQCLRGVGDGVATILLQNRLHGDVDCSVLCTTHKAETWFGFNYLQFMGLYSKCHELAFNQWVAGSSPARLITHLKSALSPPTAISKDAKMTNYDDIFQTWIREKEILDR